ncbi:hypothetical protein [Rhodococcus sp. T2V]|nr:hypothetical protein [Rhodococcus sp. T2V]
MRTEFVPDAIEMAVRTRGGDVRGEVFHGDYSGVWIKPRNGELCCAD